MLTYQASRGSLAWHAGELVYVEDVRGALASVTVLETLRAELVRVDSLRGVK